MRMLLSFQRPPSLSKEGLPSGETDPTHVRGRFMGQPRSIALSRSQAAKAALADLQHLPVGALAGHIVLAGRQLRLAERHSALIDQPPRLRAGETELARHQAG